MFIGHIGLALAAKSVAPKPSLGTLTLAAQWADGLWPVFLLLGWEQVSIVPGITAVTPLRFVSSPYSHSLLADVGWGLLLGGVYFALRRDANGAFWLFALVISHWVLAFISHRADMPLWPGGTPCLRDSSVPIIEVRRVTQCASCTSPNNLLLP